MGCRVVEFLQRAEWRDGTHAIVFAVGVLVPAALVVRDGQVLWYERSHGRHGGDWLLAGLWGQSFELAHLDAFAALVPVTLMELA